MFFIMMKITIIGTLHKGLTSNKELRGILEKIKPNQILLEIQQADIDNNNLEDYSDEMIFAYKWAKNKNIHVNGFDSKINTLSKIMTKEDEKEIIKKQKEIVKERNFSWKELNKEKNLGILEEIENKLINKDKWTQRENEMLANIKKVINSEGIIIILTG